MRLSPVVLVVRRGVVRGAGRDRSRASTWPCPCGTACICPPMSSGPERRGRFPTILVRTPYGKGRDISPNYAPFVEHGYAVVVQDVRGRYESEGVFRPLEQEPADGDDTLNWIARQPWSDGKIGMMGGSYLGIVQWKVAVLNNPHLKAIFPVVSGCDDYRDRFYSPGGAMKLGHRLLWMSENMRAPRFHPDFSKFMLHLPLRTADVAATGRYPRCSRKPWRIRPTMRSGNRSACASSWTRSGCRCFRWADGSIISWRAIWKRIEALRKNSGVHRILIGPWPHNMSVKLEGVDFGPDAMVPMRAHPDAVVRPVAEGQRHAAAVAAAGAHFRDGREPLARRAGMAAARARPSGSTWRAGAMPTHWRAMAGWTQARPRARAGPDRFVFDPQDPVPTAGGAVCCNPKVFPWGPLDQRAVEQRRDVLVYTTAALRKDVEVIGPVRVVLYAATSARDTDFTAKLVDVFPDGRAQNLTDGILRLRYRKSLEKPELARAGRDLQADDRRGRDRQRVPEGPSHPDGDFEQQFSALRPQSEYGRAGGGRDGAAQGVADDLSRCAAAVVRAAAGGGRLTWSRLSRYFAGIAADRRGSQVVRPGSAKPLFVGSIPTRASSLFNVNPIGSFLLQPALVCVRLWDFGADIRTKSGPKFFRRFHEFEHLRLAMIPRNVDIAHHRPEIRVPQDRR